MGKTASATGLAEGNLAIGQGKQRMILAHADILTGVEFGAALTDNDIAGNYAFPAKFFSRQGGVLRNPGRYGNYHLLFYEPYRVS